MVASTSREAYRTLKSLNQDQIVAHSQIKLMSAGATKESDLPSRRDAAHELGWETSKIAGRVNELVRYGFVVEKGSKIDTRTGRRVKTLTTANPFADRSY